MTINERNSMLIDGNELFKNLYLLNDHVMYSDDFAELPKEKQTEVFNYCKLHANNPVIIENLKQIRYAVTKIYFGCY